MKTATPLPTVEEILDWFEYEPENGILRGPKGSTGTKIQRGYRQHWFRGRNYLVHRLIWKIETGEDPIGVDHINGDTTDNRFSNLREANQVKNGVNRGKPSNNTSGFKGVSWHKQGKGWAAQLGIRVDGARSKIHLGLFDTPEEAARAYDEKALELHGEFAKLNFPKEDAA